MRTTLAIDDDVLAAAKKIARTDKKSVGEVITALARTGLRVRPLHRRVRNGVPLLPFRSGATPVTPELVHQLQEE